MVVKVKNQWGANDISINVRNTQPNPPYQQKNLSICMLALALNCRFVIFVMLEEKKYTAYSLEEQYIQKLIWMTENP